MRDCDTSIRASLQVCFIRIQKPESRTCANPGGNSRSARRRVTSPPKAGQKQVVEMDARQAAGDHSHSTLTARLTLYVCRISPSTAYALTYVVRPDTRRDYQTRRSAYPFHHAICHSYKHCICAGGSSSSARRPQEIVVSVVR